MLGSEPVSAALTSLFGSLQHSNSWPDVAAHAFDPCTQEAEEGRVPETEASLVYTGSSRLERAAK